jgi:hypothetical protein
MPGPAEADKIYLERHQVSIGPNNALQHATQVRIAGIPKHPSQATRGGSERFISAVGMNRARACGSRTARVSLAR